MSKRRLALPLCCLLLTLTAPAYGASSAVTRKVATFSAVEVSGALELDISVGPVASVRLEGDPLATAAVLTEVVGKTLKIRQKSVKGPALSWKNRSVRCEIVTQHVDSIAATGACHLTGRNLTGPSLRLVETGASSAVLSGKVTRLTASLTGACQLDTVRLAAMDAIVEATGASHIVVNAAKTLVAKASGASEVKFSGHPKLTVTTSGTSEVLPR